jgi:glycosyltransferase involved in cell wall biosynthesis
VKNPKVSIVTIVYNDVNNIRTTVESVLALNYPNFEYILIDGGSTDGTLDVLKEYSNRFAYFESAKDKGIYDAMNKGAAHATGEWVNYMHCGDRFASPDSLKFFSTETFDNVDIIYGNATKVYPTFEITYPRYPLKEMWKVMPFCHQSMFVKTALMQEFKFDESLKLAADFDFVLRSYKAGKVFRGVDDMICIFDHTVGLAIVYPLRSTRERRQIVMRRDFSVKHYLYYFFFELYIRASVVAKKLLGKKLTASITRTINK